MTDATWLARMVTPLWLVIAMGVAMAGDVVSDFRADTAGQGQAALALARQALIYSIRTHEPMPPPGDLPPLLGERAGVFVSAMVDGAPRICMGTLEPAQPTIADEITANACQAAVHDKRFAPLKASELPRLRVIVSIVGARTPITDPTTLDPVNDGLAVVGPNETGVVLPGETGSVEKMLEWGRVRAGVADGDPVHYLRLDAVRYVEPEK